MTTVAQLKAAAAEVRAYWRTKKPEPELSEPGRKLLALIDSPDGVLVERAELERWRQVILDESSLHVQDDSSEVYAASVIRTLFELDEALR